jgi:toxin ParE1/3/4
MKTLVIADAARDDLRAIARQTEQEWGAAQRHRYLDAIKRRLVGLREHPMLGSPRDELGRGYRSIPIGRHVVFYKIAADSVEIVRVLHASMDVYRRLDPERTGRG